MYASIIDSIGNTPLVKIRTLNSVPGVTILAKLEYMNPGGSIKDRAALSMITQAEADGELTADKTVIEATSGNTGIGLAMVCAVKGYKLALAMSESASEERKKILKARGARIILTPGTWDRTVPLKRPTAWPGNTRKNIFLRTNIIMKPTGEPTTRQRVLKSWPRPTVRSMPWWQRWAPRAP